MDVRNCRKCGKIFNYVAGLPICPACQEIAEKKFQEVKDFMRENHGAGIEEICETCEVEKNQIHQWIREERLVFSDDSPVGINCEKCGVSIKTGRFCEKCKKSMSDNLKSVIARPQEVHERDMNRSSSARMHFLDH